jgi:hypothetical protein
MVEKYGVRLPKNYEKSATSPQTAHFTEELEEEILKMLEALRAGMRKNNAE